MTIADTDIRFYAASDGSTGAAFPSLGHASGPRTITVSGATAYSTVVLSSNINALFDIVTGVQSEQAGGYSDYRIIYVRNTAVGQPVAANIKNGSDPDEFSALNLRLYLNAVAGKHSAVQGDPRKLVLLNDDAGSTVAGSVKIGMAGVKKTARAPLTSEILFPAVAGAYPADGELTDEAVDVNSGIQGWNDTPAEHNTEITLNNSPDAVDDSTARAAGTGINGDWIEVYIKRTYLQKTDRDPLADVTINLVAAFDRQAAGA